MGHHPRARAAAGAEDGLGVPARAEAQGQRPGREVPRDHEHEVPPYPGAASPRAQGANVGAAPRRPLLHPAVERQPEEPHVQAAQLRKGGGLRHVDVARLAAQGVRHRGEFHEGGPADASGDALLHSPYHQHLHARPALPRGRVPLARSAYGDHLARGGEERRVLQAGQRVPRLRTRGAVSGLPVRDHHREALLLQDSAERRGAWAAQHCGGVVRLRRLP
mmetsp:Transcript_38809/g.123284  ORF Transcript_38809/g.123284 Transcript_38809/m.123284 type:complete len:220 (+) Transcript_38809:2646-3305(+)